MLLPKLARRLALSCELSAAAIFTVVCLLNFTQVIGRYAIGSSLTWAEEIMRYSMIWVMMLGGTAAIYRGDHMAVDSVVEALPSRRRHILRSVLFGIGGTFCVMLAWYGWPAAINNAQQSAAASGLPMILPYLALPIGAVLMLAQIVLCWIVGFHSTVVEEEAW
ncbi:TRAP transporter small permease [Rubellimicrobium roseum]|uniref:TRAP transporter small permease protein n=1 Tax=Rubellimicrobium roseum TaxID=687525 RepID=A0A5C4N3E3_9RHOB|nr:TRAP transporter small permease [Rubellimicrobium roseum]TNC60050.1 TRAP transporter small permease [Rubellimicrobium roseum]